MLDNVVEIRRINRKFDLNYVDYTISTSTGDLGLCSTIDNIHGTGLETAHALSHYAWNRARAIRVVFRFIEPVNFLAVRKKIFV